MDSGGGPGPPRPADAPAPHLPPSHDSTIGLFPFNPAVPHQQPLLGVQIAPRGAVMPAANHASAPFPNLPFIPNLQQVPAVTAPRDTLHRINPPHPLMHHLNPVAPAPSAAIPPASVAQSPNQPQSNDFLGELQKVFGANPNNPANVQKNASAFQNVLAMAMENQGVSPPEQVGVRAPQTHPQIPHAQLQHQQAHHQQAHHQQAQHQHAQHQQAQHQQAQHQHAQHQQAQHQQAQHQQAQHQQAQHQQAQHQQAQHQQAQHQQAQHQQAQHQQGQQQQHRHLHHQMLQMRMQQQHMHRQQMQQRHLQQQQQQKQPQQPQQQEQQPQQQQPPQPQQQPQQQLLQQQQPHHQPLQQPRHHAPHQQSILPRQQPQMQPILQPKHVAPGQLNAPLLLPGETLPGRPQFSSASSQERTLAPGHSSPTSSSKRKEPKSSRKQQARRPRAKPAAKTPTSKNPQLMNALLPGPADSLAQSRAQQQQQQQQQQPHQTHAISTQMPFNAQQSAFLRSNPHMQQAPQSMHGVHPMQATVAHYQHGNIQGSGGVTTGQQIASNSLLNNSTVVQQSQIAQTNMGRSGPTEGQRQGIANSALPNAGRMTHGVPKGNPDLAKFDAATLQSVLASTNEPKIQAAIKQQLEYLQYAAAVAKAQQQGHPLSHPSQFCASTGFDSSKFQQHVQGPSTAAQSSMHIPQVAMLQRQQLLQKQQMFRQQQEHQRQQQQQQRQNQQQQQQQQQQQTQHQQRLHQQRQQTQQQQQHDQQHLQQQQHQHQQQRQQQHLYQLQHHHQREQQQHRYHTPLQQQQLTLQQQQQMRAQQQRPASQAMIGTSNDIMLSQGFPGIQHSGPQVSLAPQTLPSAHSQFHNHQLQAANRAQHSQSSHSQSASQGAVTGIAMDTQTVGSQNSQRASNARRRRRSPKSKANSMTVNGIGVTQSQASAYAAQNSVTGNHGLLKSIAEGGVAIANRVAPPHPSHHVQEGLRQSNSQLQARSPAEAAAQAAQAAQLAAGTAVNAQLKKEDEQRIAWERKRLAHEAQLENIALQKKRRLEIAPWNDYQRVLAPDYVTPFSGVVDAWHRLLPYHIVHTDEEKSVTKKEWESEVEKLSEKYRDCFKSLKGSMKRLFDVADQSIGRGTEFPGYCSLNRDDSITLESVILQDHYEGVRKQELISREKEVQKANEAKRQRELAERRALRAQAAARAQAEKANAEKAAASAALQRTQGMEMGEVSDDSRLSWAGLAARMRPKVSRSAAAASMRPFSGNAPRLPMMQQVTGSHYMVGERGNDGSMGHVSQTGVAGDGEGGHAPSSKRAPKYPSETIVNVLPSRLGGAGGPRVSAGTAVDGSRVGNDEGPRNDGQKGNESIHVRTSTAQLGRGGASFVGVPWQQADSVSQHGGLKGGMYNAGMASYGRHAMGNAASGVRVQKEIPGRLVGGLQGGAIGGGVMGVPNEKRFAVNTTGSQGLSFAKAGGGEGGGVGFGSSASGPMASSKATLANGKSGEVSQSRGKIGEATDGGEAGQKGQTSHGRGVDGVGSSRAGSQGEPRRGTGGEMRGMGMGSLLNADGS